MKRYLILLFVAISIMSVWSCGSGTPDFARGMDAFYVSLKGSDEWSGRLADPSGARRDGPFRTLERAREAVRKALRDTENNKPVAVFVRARDI